jgi:hypothetical protein
MGIRAIHPKKKIDGPMCEPINNKINGLIPPCTLLFVHLLRATNNALLRLARHPHIYLIFSSQFILVSFFPSEMITSTLTRREHFPSLDHNRDHSITLPPLACLAIRLDRPLFLHATSSMNCLRERLCASSEL